MRYKSNKKNRFFQRYLSKKNSLWIVGSIFFGVQVLFTIQTVTSGAKLAALEVTEKDSIKKNQELNQSLVKFTSLVEMQGTADELGFGEPENTLYISIEEFVAKVP